MGMAITAVSGKIGRAVARWRWQRRVAREWRAVEGSEQLRRFYELVAETAVRGNILGSYGAGTVGGVGGDPRGALLAAQIVCAEAARDAQQTVVPFWGYDGDDEDDEDEGD